MRENSLKNQFLFFIIMIFSGVLLAGCTGKGNDSGKNLSKESITLGILYRNQQISKMVKQFNENNADYEIEVIDYSTYESGIDRMVYDMISGKGPDIINFGGGYSESLGVKGLTADLYEIMEGDEDFQLKDYYGNIIDSMAMNGDLHILSPSYTIISFAGRGNFSDDTGWTIGDMYQYFSQLPESSIFFPGDTKKAVFGYLCTGSMNNFIDWSTGECYFTSEEFKTMLRFANTFPSEFNLDEEKSILGMFQSGEALLYPSAIHSVWEVTAAKIILNSEEIRYIGYPVTKADKQNGTTGNVVNLSEIILGINQNSDQKTIAWEFIKSFLEEEYQENISDALPLHRQVMEKRIEAALKGVQTEEAEYSIRFEGEEELPITQITDKDARQLRELVETTTRSSSVDYQLYNIILEEAEGFLDGAKTLEDTANIIQGRVQVYVAEQY